MFDSWRLWTSATTEVGRRGGEAEDIVNRVLQLHEKLSRMKDLKPCISVNDIFTDLVGLSTKTIRQDVTEKVLSNPSILAILPSLRQLCAESEYLLESYWAVIIAGNENDGHEQTVWDRLESFPYFSNYVDLTKMELSAIDALGKAPRRIAFIGSGPLPLTSLCIGHFFRCRDPPACDVPTNRNSDGVVVSNIDHNSEAITQSQKLCQRLGSKADGMEFLCAEAKSSARNLSDFDVVYLAALVGSSQTEKEETLVSVVSRMRTGALLVIRSAERLRRLMYAEFDATTARVTPHLEILMVIHPYNHIVNSVIVGKVK